MPRRFILVAFLGCAVAAAQDTASVSIEASPSTVEAGEPFMLSVQVTGSGYEKLIFPEVDGLIFPDSPLSTVTQMRRTPSGVSQVVGFGFKVETTTPGTFEIPFVTATVNGKDIVSNPVSITVIEATTPKRGRSATLQRSPSGSAMAPPPRESAASQDTTLTIDEVISISADVDKRNVFQGEPITLSLTFMCLVNVEPNEIAHTLPSITGFYALPREPIELGPPESRTIQGRDYEVHTLKQTLFPTVSGDLEIGAWQWQGALLVRGRRPYPVELSSDPIAIRVNPLPERPANFSGSVGLFTVDATLDKSRVIQGVPVKLNVRITGEGNPDAVGVPQLPTMDWAYVGDVEKDAGQQSAGMGAGVDQRFIFPVTPIEAGTKVIPEIVYCYFNPETGVYETARTSPLELSIAPSAEPAHQGVVGAGSESPGPSGIAADIDSIVLSPGVLTRQSGSALTVSLVAVAPPVVYAALAVFLRRRRRLATDTRFARSYRARTRLKTALDSVRTSQEPAPALFKAVVGFIADKFDVPEAGMTSLDAQHTLEQNGISPETISALVKVLRSCERAQYASTILSQHEIAALLEGASVNLDALDAELGRRADT